MTFSIPFCFRCVSVSVACLFVLLHQKYSQYGNNRKPVILVKQNN